MRKPQISLLTASVTVASLLLASTTSFAAHKSYKENYKGEVPCPVELVLKDGLYVGLQAGYDSYRVVDQIGQNDTFWYDEQLTPALVSSPLFGMRNDPRLNSTGAVGGGFIGFGKYFDTFYNTYLGLEIFGNWSGAYTDWENYITYQATAPVGYDIYRSSFQVNSNYGISVLPGVKLNNATLFYVRLGYNWANVEAEEAVATNMAVAPVPARNIGDWTSYSDSETVGGFNYGVGIESTFYDNWSVRAEYAHTDFNSFTTTFNNEFTAADNQFMLGLIYHITM